MQLPMAKIQVISTHRQIEATLAVLQRLGTVQLEDATDNASNLTRLLLDPAAESQREILGFLLVRMDSVLGALPPVTLPAPGPEYESAASRSFEALAAVVGAGLDEAAAEVHTLTRRREELVSEEQSLPRYETTIRNLSPLAAEIPQFDRVETVALLIDRQFGHVLQSLEAEVSLLTEDQFEIVSNVVDKQTIGAILVFPKEYSSVVNDLLGQKHISQVRLPDELMGVPFHRVLSTLRSRLSAIPTEIASVDTRLAELSARWYADLTLWRSVVRDRLSVLNARNLLAATEHTFVISGWISQGGIGALRQELHEEIGDEVIVVEMPLSQSEQENAPVVLENPAIVQPFEALIRLLALPRYATIDPSALMAFFMPLFFGMILGDVAYGLVVIALGMWLRRRFSGTIHDLGGVLLFGGVWAVAFGFLYGELLGTLGEAFGLHPVLDRTTAVVPMFATAIAMGVVQVLLGIVLGLWMAIRQRHLKHVSEKVGMLISLLGLFAIVAVIADLLPDSFFTPLLVVILIGVVLLSVPMGMIGVLLGPLELLGTLGNVLSYLRIAAIGLSSVYLAEVANEMAGLTGNVFLGVIVAGLFHILNVALGVVSPTIQALRLQYVEFFGKFFEGGGKPFRPFKREDTHYQTLK